MKTNINLQFPHRGQYTLFQKFSESLFDFFLEIKQIKAHELQFYWR
ncbi:hypothetical protein I2486_03795 [Cellulophaga sp. E16_2]|nr:MULTISPECIES: hypothetical protein [Cellulophaga]MBO0590522.1 hypothetical protein [Cellulophaga sp. E16_2]